MLPFCTYLTAFLAAGLAGWIDRTFGPLTVNQLVYHLYYADTAAVYMGEVFIVTFLTEAVAAPLAAALAATWLHRRLAAASGNGWGRRALRTAPGLAVAAGTGLLLLQFSAFSFAAAHFQQDYFSDGYRDPGQVALSASGRPRNLVLIYVESLENAYGNADLFGKDLLAPLGRLGGHSFAAYHQVPGATWTIAGMVATQCGVPLAVYSSEEMRFSDEGRAFLPGATCLGDILQAHGYRNVFMGGAPLSFAGKGTFLRDHGYGERYGKEEWVAAGTRWGDLGGWGLFDDALLARARKRLAELHASGQPFNLTLLTLDTHNPQGFVSPTCARQGVRDFAGLVGCTSGQLAEFVRFAQDQGYLEDTVLVILGDHLAVGNPVYDKVRRQADRTIVNLFVGAPAPPRPAQALVPFDMFPSLLDILGIKVPGGRLGLGVSAWADPLPAERPQGLEHMHLPSLAASRAYTRLWRRPEPAATPAATAL